MEFNRDIRPVLNRRCLSCHGGVKRASGLGLRFREEALAPARSGRRAVVPGRPEESEILARVGHEDPGERMPPEGEPLSGVEIERLTEWIRGGAEWGVHWAYVAPRAGEIPGVEDPGWERDPLDRFVLARLEREGLEPAPPADPAVWLRRVSLDLTGLPPSPAELEEFLADASEAGRERVVDGYLESPHFGERWAAMWLDLARYADTKGYEKDGGRTIWRYRDWLVEAFNRDMPYDRFTVEQMAGDLLARASDEQRIATAFHRNTMTNDEGGTDDEEFRVAAVIDRVNTTFEVWMGTTLSCAQCHDHPYDPFEQHEYYEFMAFLNNTADADHPSEQPTLETYSPPDRQRRKELLEQRAAAEEAPRRTTAETLALAAELAAIEEGLAALRPVSTPVLSEIPPTEARVTRVFDRGNWLAPLEEVAPGVPAALPPFGNDRPLDRLGLAQWMVDPGHPLTARVAVNRFWEQLFGVGLVETLEDFGTQGEAPSHPRLLDWLAVRFMNDQHWSVKQFLRAVVLSATYGQSSAVTPEKLERDPRNRLLARGPRFRLSAEQVRDVALSASGLLNPALYGPSVMPVQPDGIWQSVYSGETWETSEGGDRYRRGVYTYWKRTSPYPSMVTFDAPTREFCVSRRIRTNTPLQALITFNDPVYVEAAEALASRMEAEGGPTLEDRIRYGFRLVQARAPHPADVEELVLLHAYSPGTEGLSLVAAALLNLDSTLTKE